MGNPHQPNMIKTGITGGIGSGKTTVCKLFEQLGVPVYYADDRAKYLMQNEPFVIDALMRAFGADIYTDGTLNRKLLADRAFNSKEQVAKLNSIVHPAVFLDNDKWLGEQQAKGVPYVIKEAALLIETGSYKKLDKLIVVTAPEDVRIKRIQARDNSTEEEVRARIQHQLPEEEKVKLAHYVITNNGDTELLHQQVADIHAQLLELSKTGKR
jgi:dephospho-CoA kinase